ncbi:MAG: ABC transporter permease [Gemmatimonadetes bacterium]|nr:ABC transporter permease [Gemmatimonadota bacterium]
MVAPTDGVALLEAFLAASVRTATPLALAALGETVSERGGVINIGVEGSIIAGALGGTIAAASLGVGGGFAAGALAGVAMAALFALFVVGLKGDAIITGTAVTLFALGLTGTLYRTVFGAGGVALSSPTAAVVEIPGLTAIPVVGAALFAQPLVTYGTVLLAPLLTWALFRTHWGVSLRAVGEAPEAAIAAGVHPGRLQLGAILLAGALAGVAGATLVLAQAGTFVEGMSAGRGFIAIAIVVLGRRHPVGVALAALLFGGAQSLQTLFQAMGWTGVPYQLFLAVPYVLTLVAMTASGRGAIRHGHHSPRGAQ